MEMVAALGLDIAVVAILLCCICRAAKKGFLRTVIQMAAYICILLVSAAVSRQAAPVIYTRVIEPAIFEKYLDFAAGGEKDNAALVSANVSRPGGLLMISPARGNLFFQEEQPDTKTETEQTPERPADGSSEQLVRAVIDGVLRQLEENGEGFSELLRKSLAEVDFSRLELDGLDFSALEELYANGELPGMDELIPPEVQLEILREITGQTIRPAVVGVLNLVCFAVSFGVLSLVVNLLLAMLGVVKYLPVIGRINAFLGGVTGFFQGLLLVWVAALLVYGLLALCGGSWWILSDDVVEKSLLFQYFIFPGILGG